MMPVSGNATMTINAHGVHRWSTAGEQRNGNDEQGEDDGEIGCHAGSPADGMAQQ